MRAVLVDSGVYGRSGVIESLRFEGPDGIEIDPVRSTKRVRWGFNDGLHFSGCVPPVGTLLVEEIPLGSLAKWEEVSVEPRPTGEGSLAEKIRFSRAQRASKTAVWDGERFDSNRFAVADIVPFILAGTKVVCWDEAAE